MSNPIFDKLTQLALEVRTLEENKKTCLEKILEQSNKMTELEGEISDCEDEIERLENESRRYKVERDLNKNILVAFENLGFFGRIKYCLGF